MSVPTQVIVDAITDVIQSDVAFDIFTEIQQRFPGTTDAEFDRCIRIAEWEHRQRAEEYDREAEHFENLREMFSSLPANTTTGQAAKIRAAEGSEFAIALLEHLQSDKVRLNNALTMAAAEAHPGWKLNPDKTIQQLSDEGPDTLEALVDWFQVTYPLKAREIERRLIKESSGGAA